MRMLYQKRKQKDFIDTDKKKYEAFIGTNRVL